MSSENSNITSQEATQENVGSTATLQVVPVIDTTTDSTTTEESKTVAEIKQVATEENEVGQKDTSETGDKGTDRTTTQKVETEDEVFAKYGLSKDEIIEFKKRKDTESEPSTDDKMFADLTAYAIKSKKATKDDVVQYENIQKADSNTLVYNKFAEAKRNEDSYISDEEIKEAFDFEYYVNSEDEKLKAHGKEIIAKEGNEIKSPILEKIESIKKDFVISQNMGAFKSQQETIVNEFNKHPLKASVTVDGHDINIEVLPEVSFDDLKKHLMDTEEGRLQNNLLFTAFIEDRNISEKGLGQLLSSIANSKVEQKKLDMVANSAYEKGIEKGKGNTIGAKSPFSSKQEALKTSDSPQNNMDAFNRMLDSRK